MPEQKNHLILLVEDSDEDYFATIRAFKKANLNNKIVRCINGDEAIDYLFRRSRFKEPETSPRPGIILLDLNLPGTDGREVLKEIKKNPDLRKIPVIVMTTSSSEQDIDQCYNFGANSYIMKPISFNGYIEAIQKIKNYWFEIVLLPKD